MKRDRSKFAKLQEPSLEEFAEWVLSEELKNKKPQLEYLVEAVLHYRLCHERTIINRKNYRYWVEWMKKNREKALLLYPCHCNAFMDSETDTFQQDGY